ncbi:high mobility group box domain-containing protein [Mucidula mucida]|nr:high mobility group box domain-containing protein [Mucidula mucida]
MAPSPEELPGMEFVRDLRGLASAMSACAASAEKCISYYAALTGLEESGKRKRVAKVPRDPRQPKRPASSYLLYQIEKRQALKETYPELSHGELGKLISSQWATMSEADKKPYVDRHAEADKKYKSDMTDFKATAAADGDIPSPPLIADNKAKKEKVVKPIVPAKNEGSKSKKSVKSPEVVSDSDEEGDDDDEVSVTSSAGKANGDDSDSSASSSEEEEAPPPKKHKVAPKEQEKKKRKA